MSEKNLGDTSGHLDTTGIPILPGPPTPAEQSLREERRKREAKEASDYTFQERQVQAVEASNNLARKNFYVSLAVGIVAATACAATVYQGLLIREQGVTAQATLDEMRDDAQASSSQFQVQLRHFDDGLGRTGLLAEHAGQQVEETKKFSTSSEKGANATRKSVEIADKTLRASQRPWVNAESFTPSVLTLPPNGTFEVDGELVMKNTGTSVATDGWLQVLAAPNTARWLTSNWDRACQMTDQAMSASRIAAANGLGGAWPIGFVLAPNQETKMRIGVNDSDGTIQS